MASVANGNHVIRRIQSAPLGIAEVVRLRGLGFVASLTRPARPFHHLTPNLSKLGESEVFGIGPVKKLA
jgi:hypothetical protein